METKAKGGDDDDDDDNEAGVTECVRKREGRNTPNKHKLAIFNIEPF